MSDSTERRLTELEIQLAHTQRACEQLNEVVTQLSLTAQSRERSMQRMADQIQELKNSLSENASQGDEKPPHY